MAKQSGAAVRAAGDGNPVGPWLRKALDDGRATLFPSGKQERIRYTAVNHEENYGDPEEWVRADFWAELIYRYKYPEDRIAVEVPVPDRVPGDLRRFGRVHGLRAHDSLRGH